MPIPNIQMYHSHAKIEKAEEKNINKESNFKQIK